VIEQAKELSEELNKRGFQYIWLETKGNSIGRVCKISEKVP